MGKDQILGGGLDDILIAGQVAGAAAESDALKLILEEWTSDRRFEERAENIHRGTGDVLGGTAIMLETGITVLDDDERDKSFGNGGQDWFLADPDEDRIV